MWSNGRAQSYDDGTGGKQTYGVHPFALVQTKQPGEFVGIYFRNTNAASPIITHKNDTTGTISYITTGGQIEVFFFLKDNAKNVIKAYQNFIGKPSLPPFWALGWHASTTADPATTL
jgi:alpha-glucosidase (family GH31 glycosyl hydrolase)